MKNSIFKALIVFLAAVTVLPGCGDSKSAKKAPILIQNPRSAAVGAADQIAPGQAVSDISDMPAAEPVERVGRPASSKEKSARQKGAGAGSSASGATVRQIVDSQEVTATKPQVNPVAKPAPKAETPLVVSLIPLSVNMMSAEDLANKETLVGREIIAKIGLQISRLSSANRAVPVSDESYEQRVFSSNENPYITNTVYHTITSSDACSIGTSRGCVVFEKDTRSGQTKTRAYFLGIQIHSFNSGAPRVLRAEVNDKSLQADILEVLKSKADGIYIYTVTGGAAATPAVSVVSAAPSVVTSLPATPKKNTPVPQTKPDVKAKPAVKAAAKAEIKPVAQADQKPVIKAEVKRSLPVNLFYRGDLDQKETDNDKALIAKIWSRSNIMKAQRAVNVSNEAYGVRLISTDTNPYISNDLYLSLVSTAACDLNLVGACVVFEKDSTSGKSVTNSYYVGSAPMNNFSSEVRVARSDVKDKTLQADVSEVLKSKADGIYVYSVAESAYQVKEAAKNSISAEEAAKIAGETVALTAASAAAAVQIITDETEAAKARREIQEYVAKYTSSEDTKKRMSSAKGGKWVHNDCIIKSVQNDEDPKHGLRTVRRIFILDFVNVARMFQGKAEMPLKIGKGRILCNMWDGKVQRVPVEIKEYVSPFTVGLVLSKSNQNLVAAGVGFANGAVDILMEKDFAGLVEVDAMALIGGLSFAPVILNGTGKGTPFILATQISVNPKWLLINTRASLGVRYEIGVDPDET